MASQLERLRQIAAQAPAMNQDAARRASEAQSVQFQAGLAGAPAGAGARQAQSIAPAVTAAAGEAAAGVAKQAVAQQAQIGELGGQVAAGEQRAADASAALGQSQSLSAAERSRQLGEASADLSQQGQLAKEDVAQRERILDQSLNAEGQIQFLTRQQTEGLSKLGRDTKAQLFDSRLKFTQDETGRKFANEQQTMDYALVTAKSEDQLQDRMQKMSQIHERTMKMKEVSFQKLQQALNQEYLSAKQAQDQGSMLKIAQVRKEHERAAAKAKAAAANRSEMIKAGTMIGMAAGTALIPIPGVGTAVGVAVGYGASTLASNAFS